MTNKTIYIGLHIPKTAGMTLLNLLEKKFPLGNLHQTTSLAKNAELGIPFIEEMANTENIESLFGHHVDAQTICYFPNREIYLYTFIREPISRLISHFYYHERLCKAQNRESLSLQEFADSNKNQMCKFIVNRFSVFLSKEELKSLSLHEKAIKILQTFDLVGSSDEFDEYLLLLLQDMKVEKEKDLVRKIGKKNVNPHKNNKQLDLEENTEFKDILVKENGEDCKLYEYYQVYSKESKRLKNPFGFSEELKQSCVEKVLKEGVNKEQRLKSLYQKAANEYKNHGILKKVIGEQKQILLANALKLSLLIEQDRQIQKTNTKDIYQRVKEIIEKYNST